MYLAIADRWHERETVFVADELRNFRVSPVKILLILREIDAPPGNARKFAQGLVGCREPLLDKGAVLFLLT